MRNRLSPVFNHYCIALLVHFSLFFFTGCESLPEEVTVAWEDYQTAKSTLVLAVAGDVLLAPNCAWRSSGEVAGDCCDYSAMMQPARSYLKEADFAFCNLEAPLSLRGSPAPRQWNFRAAPHTVEALTQTGFSIVSLANNHVLDYGEEALADTLHHLQTAGIRYSGISSGGDEQQAVVVEAKGVRLAFLSYTNVYPADYYRANIRPVRATGEGLQRDISEALQDADHVVVSIHWGEEYNPSVTKEQRHLGRFMIDAGATAVLGHHPHILQEPERYKEGLIIYSLGNFLFSQGRLRTPETRVYTLFLNKEGIRRVSYIPFKFEVQPWRMSGAPFSRKEWMSAP
jgi:poly-gamma-glutamate capsule biosynthesis protein CapA/YwtB (metallophosphatase superfamily)